MRPVFVFDFRLRLRLRRDKSPWQAAGKPGKSLSPEFPLKK